MIKNKKFDASFLYNLKMIIYFYFKCSKLISGGYMNEDKLMYVKELQGEGRWFQALGYKDNEGNEYEVWQDIDGDEKVVEVI